MKLWVIVVEVLKILYHYCLQMRRTSEVVNQRVFVFPSQRENNFSKVDNLMLS
jgi:hypothetical protein